MRIRHLFFFLCCVLILLSCDQFKSKPQLQATILEITAKQDISEWIMAEYYGEALYSHQEAVIAWKRAQIRAKKADTLMITLDDDIGLWRNEVTDYYVDLHEIANEVWNNLDKKRYKEVDNVFREEYPEMISNPYYAQLREMISDRDRKFWKYIRENNLVRFDSSRGLLQNFINKQEKESDDIKDLVFLGRGWVKAGLDFKKITLESIEMNKGVPPDTIIIRDVYPQIFNADINPWFIPDKSPGFEIIEWKRKRRFTFADVQRIKTGCKQRLVQDAIERGILDVAISTAEEHFLNLIHLLGYPNIKVVKIELSDTYSEDYLWRTNYNFGKPDPFTEQDTLIEADELERVIAMVARNRTPGRDSFLNSLIKKNKEQAVLGLVDSLSIVR